MTIDTKALRELHAVAACDPDDMDALTDLNIAASMALPALLDAAERLAAIESLSETGTAQAFAALSDDMKLRWFIITGKRDKWARERIAELEAENGRLKRLLVAVRPEGCDDVDDVNWYDARDEALAPGDWK